MIDHSLPTAERISLITDLLSDSDGTGVANHLSEDDAQSLVDVVDEVFTHYFTSEGSADFDPNFPVLPNRRWIV